MALNPNQAADPNIAMDEIQGDVLLGLTKKWQAFVFFAIKDKVAFKKQFARSLLKEVTTTRQVQADMARIADHRKTRPHRPAANLWVQRGLHPPRSRNLDGCRC